jgi:hypothetical protein
MMRPKLNATVDAIVSTPHDENIQMKTQWKKKQRHFGVQQEVKLTSC